MTLQISPYVSQIILSSTSTVILTILTRASLGAADWVYNCSRFLPCFCKEPGNPTPSPPPSLIWMYQPDRIPNGTLVTLVLPFFFCLSKKKHIYYKKMLTVCKSYVHKKDFVFLRFTVACLLSSVQWFQRSVNLILVCNFPRDHVQYCLSGVATTQTSFHINITYSRWRRCPMLFNLMHFAWFILI